MANLEKYGVFESTFIKGRCFSFISDEAIENGALVTKGPLINDSKDIYKAETPTLAGEERVYVVGNPAKFYGASGATDKNESNYINDPEVPFRVYELEPTDVFAISDYSIDPINASTPPARDQYVSLQDNSMRLKASATLPTDGAFIGRINWVRMDGAVYNVGREVDQTSNKVLIEVLKNG